MRFLRASARPFRSEPLSVRLRSQRTGRFRAILRGTFLGFGLLFGLLSAASPSAAYNLLFDGGVTMTTVDEGDPVQVTVSVDPPPGCIPWSIDWNVSINDIATDSSDYGTPPTSITLSDNQPTTVIGFLSLDDAIVEGDEAFEIVLTPGLNTNIACVPDTPSAPNYTLLVDIIDNDTFAPPSFRVDDVSVLEGDSGPQTIDVTVTMDNPDLVGGAFSVDFETFDGTATQIGNDFEFAQGTLFFNVGAPKSQRRVDQIVQLTILGDTEFEPDEFFDLVLDNPTGGATISDNIGIIELRNDDDQEEDPIEASITDARVVEGTGPDTPATFTVTLAEASDRPLQVRYTTRPDTASAADFRGTAGVLNFAPGEQSLDFEVAVVGDDLEEPDERFFVDLSTLDPVIFFRDRRGVGTIVDDDGVVEEPSELRVEGTEVTEGDAGTTAAEFEITLDPASKTTVTVQVATRDGSATAGSDYQARTGGLVFEPGETRKTFTVPVRGDTEFEPDETFFLDLSDPDGADLAVASASTTILNDDEEADELPSIGIGDAQVFEGDEGTTTIRFDVTLDAESDDPVTVSFATRDGTAVAGADYQSRSDTLTLPPGSTRATLAFLIQGDTEDEDDETFFVDLSEPVGAEIARRTGQATIRDDDDPPGAMSAIRLLRPAAVVEGQGPAVVVVERTGMPEGPAQVEVGSASGTAVEGRDFQSVREVVRWAPGEIGPRRVSIPIADDNRREGEESFFVGLRNALGSDLAEPSRVTVTILDDDLPVRLEPVGETTRQGTVREALELAVRVLRDGDVPVAGAVVAFVADGALLEGDGRGESDDDGVVRQRLTLRRTPGLATLRARLVGTDAEVEFTIEVRGNLTDDVGGPGDEGQQDLAGVLDEACVDATGDLGNLCDYLFDLDSSSERRSALEALTPRRLAAQNRALLRTPRTQTQNVDTRLRALRTGSVQMGVFDQLALSLRGQGTTIGALRKGTAQPTEPDQRKALARRVDLALATAAPAGFGARVTDGSEAGLLGQGSSGQGSNGQGTNGPTDDPWTDRDLDGDSPWGLFVNGRVSIGDSPQNDGGDADFDVEVGGLTAGVDYRIDENWIIGLAVGGLSTQTELAQERGGTDVDSLSVSLYGAYARDAFWIDGVVGWGVSDYEIRRIIDLPGPFQGQNSATALGRPEGDQVSLDLGAGYDWARGAWTIGGFGRLSWVDLVVDSYSETGAGPFRLAIAEQESESLQAEAGIELSRAISVAWGVVQPQLRLSYLQELEDDPVELRSRLVSDPAARVFRVLAQPSDRSFFNLEAALSATFRRGWAGFVQFDTDLARDDLDLYTLSGGFRVQF